MDHETASESCGERNHPRRPSLSKVVKAYPASDQSAAGLAELTLTISEAARTLFSLGPVFTTLNRVAKLAVTTVEGCDFAGLFLCGDDAPALCLGSIRSGLG